MKKHRIASSVFGLFIVILCVSLFTACNKIERIEENQVEKIVVWVYDSGEKEYEMTSDDAKKFIELFNTSKYEGKSTGEGGTPEFGMRVYFSDGAYLCVNDFCGLRKFEVYFHKANSGQGSSYYISSEEFSEFALELADKAKQNSD